MCGVSSEPLPVTGMLRRGDSRGSRLMFPQFQVHLEDVQGSLGLSGRGDPQGSLETFFLRQKRGKQENG